ncbi:MAG: hypothetical protein ACLVKO_06835 [Dysgonomonas sp.]
MRKTLSVVLSVCVLSILMDSCFSGKSTVIEPSVYSVEQIKSLYVYINLTDYRKYGEKIGEDLQEQLNAEGIPTKVYIVKELDLTSPEEIGAEVRKFGASHIMYIELYTALVKENYRQTDLGFGVRIHNAQNGKPLWFGGLDLKTALIKTKDETGEGVKILIERLKQDGFIKK